jgi:predicted MFS family arabinose efflux permease
MSEKSAKGPAFEWWMFSFIAAGAGFSAFISLLIPPYVTEATGDVANAGGVMAVISLAAVLGPVLGGFADKYRAHRLVLSLGVLGLALGFAAYALSAESGTILALDAILLGVSIAAVNAVGPVFILSAGLSQALQAKRLTVLNLLQPVGQVIGGVIMTAAASLDSSTRFWLARSGGMTVFTAGNVIRFVGALGMAVIGLVARSPILIAAAFMQILYQANPFVRLTQPIVAIRFATIPAGQASGWVIGGAAIGSFLGSLIGGWLASSVGYNAINWMAAIAVGAAVLLLFVGLWPAERKKQAEESATAA